MTRHFSDLSTDHLHSEIQPKDWPRILTAYSKADPARSLIELSRTVVPFLALWSGAAYAMHVSYWLTLCLCVPAAAFLTRLFIFQHDCGHRACFPNRADNDFLGRILGVVTFTPYAMWRRSHQVHHRISGNLDKRRGSDIRTLTLREYKALSKWGRFGYRAYRNPVTLFVFGPFWVFFVRYRLPIDMKNATRADWVSTSGTNLAIICTILGLGWFIGIGTVLAVHLPIALMTATLGVWLFYVQHQFEQTLWRNDENWSAQETALFGSSHYELPPIARWFTGNIGVHHVHHLSSRIPFYRLPEVLRDHPTLATTSRVSLRDSLKCLGLHLWDEDQNRLISFAKAAKLDA